MARKRFHNLKRPKIRADWSKWNLYKLSQQREPNTRTKTFFQQKWEARSMSRGYHGNAIPEQKWQLMFDRRLPGVVTMNPARLGRSNGAEWARGTGTGLKGLTWEDAYGKPDDDRSKLPATPYMNMAFWPVERRLDMAVWRALFASSALQARQFVVHGGVKVNGKKIRHPGYLLNPGDMFTVEPEKVLFATGARKHDKALTATKQPSRMGAARVADQAAFSVEEELDEKPEGMSNEEMAAAEPEKTSPEEAEAEVAPEVSAEQRLKEHRKTLRALMKQAKDILADPVEKKALSAKQKQAMRAFTREVRSTMSKIRADDTVKGKESEDGGVEPATATDTVEELQGTLARLLGDKAAPAAEEAKEATEVKAATDAEDIDAQRDAVLLKQALDAVEDRAPEEQEDPSAVVDASKPYATPWQPREYMSPFAFVPRYLEVNHKICCAVYLRHPVARAGLAEVPGPWSETTYALAHNWYLRRR